MAVETTLPARKTRQKALVRFYYSYSPPVAEFIANHDTLRVVARWGLLPVVGVSWMALHLGPGFILALMGLQISLMGTTAVVALRRMQLRHQA
jgi:hypothetical protein